ncbi:MAG TPA: plastocyanin/azurin family copper-binding protein [Candidatus Sulfomarinibacteraceae bacterium]|nr:plastocyanin/azurin family copper-binding protein [Candidatus Sulfomarinibacteraceae bacterium]
MLSGEGFLGTGAPFGADLALVAEIVLFLLLIVGIVAQRRGRFRLHDWIQTPVVLLNLALIVAIMITSFRQQQVASTLPTRPTDPYYLVVGIHAVLGLAAMGLAIYCLLAGHKILPRKIGRLRYWMWGTFGVWTLAVLAGVATYGVWYLAPSPAAATAGIEAEEQAEVGAPEAVAGDGPQARQIVMQNFEFAPREVTVVTGTEVTWVNQDGAPHNVTVVEGAEASDNFFQGESYAITFNEPGTYTVYCTLHGNPGSGMTSIVRVVAADDAEAVAAAEATAAAEPTPAPPPTATPAPTVPPAPADLVDAPQPEQIAVGIVSFFDHEAASDAVNVTLTQLAAPASNHNWQAWLTDSEGGQRLDLGLIEPDESGRLIFQYVDPQQRNLLGQYDGFQISEEPQFDDDPAPGPILYRGQTPAQPLEAIRRIVVSAPHTPEQKPFALGAWRQTEELQRHVAYVQEAYELLSIADAQRHAEHIVNILEGEQGEFFGDGDGAHGIQNPGDGFGVIPYVQAMRASAVGAGGSESATRAISTHAEHVILASDNALAWATTVREAALQILDSQSVGDIGPQVETLARYSQLLLDGEDENGDGVIAPDEGGIFTAYQHAQYMGAIGVLTDGSP